MRASESAKETIPRHNDSDLNKNIFTPPLHHKDQHDKNQYWRATEQARIEGESINSVADDCARGLWAK
jgi:hypothetical protein